MQIISVLAWCAAACWFGWTFFAKPIRYEWSRRQLGCASLPRYPTWDILFGLDYVYAMMKALKEDRFFLFQKQTYANYRFRMWSANFLGSRMLYSSRSEHLKAISTSHFEDFAIEPIRVANGALTPFTGRGISTSDGSKWAESRILIKPYFDRAAFSDLARLESHTNRLLRKIPTDGSAVDMQPLFQHWFLDTATEFLLGESVHSLEDPSEAWPHADMVTIQAGLRVRLQLSFFLFLHRDKEWLAACHRIHGFLDSHIERAYTQLEEERATGKPAVNAKGVPRHDLLWHMAKQVPDKLELRTQLTGVWIPSNETTSILMSNTIWALARNPRVVAILRREVLAYGDKPLTFEGLRSFAYLRWVVNEVHRLYPVSLQTVRACVKDAVLPTGSGEDGSSPVLCVKGDIVHCNRYLMHRDPDIWGEDAEEFRPERWEQARPLWNFAPYGGGPRICPAHVMVDTECSYAVFRILQKFRAIQARDDWPFTPVMRVGPSNKYGCQVAFVPA
jgi:cytochrome P450